MVPGRGDHHEQPDLHHRRHRPDRDRIRPGPESVAMYSYSWIYILGVIALIAIVFALVRRA
jgi:hypothetical protein